jgi:hypothetical protein
MKRGWMLVSAALVIAGIAAIVAVNVARRKAARSNDWIQTRATLERLDDGNVAYRYDAGGGTHRSVAPRVPRAIYRMGRPVLVYVNPANPAESLLQHPPIPPVWPAVVGAMAILVGAALGVWAWQEGKVKRVPGMKTSKVSGDTTSRRKAPPMSRLKAPPPANWKREDE